MADAGGQPIVPTSIEGLLIQLQRRLNEVENRERGTGRRGWNEATITLANAVVLDNGFPSWRILNDGRIELRGRITLPVALTTPTQVLRLSGRAAPLGNGTSYRSWLNTIGPCSTGGANPGVYRIDIERYIITETGGDQVFYAKVIACPPAQGGLSEWIGFDHVTYDPNIYIDTLSTVPENYLPSVFGRGKQRDDGEYIVAEMPIQGQVPDDGKVLTEFGIAILGYENGSKVSIVPGMDAPATPPPVGP